MTASQPPTLAQDKANIITVDRISRIEVLASPRFSTLLITAELVVRIVRMYPMVIAPC